jgi:predicted transcriptional regulator
MTSIELRSELKDLIDRIRDTNVLEALRTLALRQAEQDDMATEMERMADLSDEAISKGEVYTREEVEAWLKEQRPKG